MPKFRHAVANSEILKKNRAPGGEGGIDNPVQASLGADGYEGEDKKKRKGICAGITTTWIVAVLNGSAEALSCEGNDFVEFFNGVLRFQGAYFQNYLINQAKSGFSFSGQSAAEKHISLMDKLAETLAHGCEKKDFFYTKAGEIKKVLKKHKGNWAAYASLLGHAIGIASYNRKYYIMDPNYGLYEYSSFEMFSKDASQHITHRLQKLNEGNKSTNAGSQFRIVLWNKKI